MTRLKLLFWGILLASLSGCAITRHYEAESLTAQIQQMRDQMDSDRKQMEADYWSKQDFVVAAEKSGVDLKRAPFDQLANRFEALSAAKESTLRELSTSRMEIDRFWKSIEGKSRIRSDDPAYAVVMKAEKDSEKIQKTLKTSFAHYTEISDQFSQTANELKVLPVDVASFDRKISASITDIGRQSALVESTIVQFEKKIVQSKSENRTERLSLLNEMRTELSGVRSIRHELAIFRESFLNSSRGQRAYLVTPQHPNYELFQTLTGVQERAAARVTTLNEKIKAFNQIRD